MNAFNSTIVTATSATLRLSVVSWNVGGADGIVPGTDKLLSECAKSADVLVVGLQEAGLGRRGWKAEMEKALTGWSYIGGEAFAWMRIRVFARVDDSGEPVVRMGGDLRVGTGIANCMPNKGAVGVQVDVRCGKSFCHILFVLAHLAAHEHAVAEREDDLNAIMKRVVKSSQTRATVESSAEQIRERAFGRYDHVFFFGDLNYRIEAPGADMAERVRWVQDLVDRRDFGALLDADQLNRERLAGNALACFEEAHAAFAPTFKVDPKTGLYSGKRVPSYCDRVLWWSAADRVGMVRNTRYQSLPEFIGSDHLPVVAEFEVRVSSSGSPVASDELDVPRERRDNYRLPSTSTVTGRTRPSGKRPPVPVSGVDGGRRSDDTDGKELVVEICTERHMARHEWDINGDDDDDYESDSEVCDEDEIHCARHEWIVDEVDVDKGNDRGIGCVHGRLKGNQEVVGIV